MEGRNDARRPAVHRVVTIDGPAGSGKSTVSRALAERIGFLYLDTGAMYRAVALAAVREGIPFDDGRRLGALCRSLDLHFESNGNPPRIYLGEEDISKAIRSPEMDLRSSDVSAVKEVRAAMTDLQRKMRAGGDLVAEGRDMGTVVFPDAEHKFFLTASVDVRAQRRYAERAARGEEVDKEVVKEELKKRDHQDESRALAPLIPAEDAVVIDTSLMTPDEVTEDIVRQIDFA